MHMERLYERLHGEAAGDVSLALQRERSAMVSMLREPHSSVKHWAPFVVYGGLGARYLSTELRGGAWSLKNENQNGAAL